MKFLENMNCMAIHKNVQEYLRNNYKVRNTLYSTGPLLPTSLAAALLRLKLWEKQNKSVTKRKCWKSIGELRSSTGCKKFKAERPIRETGNLSECDHGENVSILHI